MHCGGMLLSADRSERVCLWKMKDSILYSLLNLDRIPLLSLMRKCIDNWICSRVFNVDSIVAAKWLNVDQQVCENIGRGGKRRDKREEEGRG